MVKNSMGEYTVLADKVGDVNSNIKNILGLEEGDFLKSVVLPQGKFSEFLSLGGKDRRNMLERIFDLEEYGSSLMFKVGRYRKGIESQVTSIRAIMSQHENISTAYLKELELNLKNTLVRKDETENGVKDLSKSLEEMKSLDSLLKDLFDAKHQEEELNKKEKYINELTKKLDLSMSMTSILGELTEFVSTRSYISDTRIKIGKNKDIIGRLREESRRFEINKLSHQKNLKNITDELERVKEIQTISDEEMSELVEVIELKKLEAQDYMRDLRSHEEYDEELKELKKDIISLNQDIKIYAKDKDQQMENLKKYQELNTETRILGMAESIREELKKTDHIGNCTCPVCGSHIDDFVLIEVRRDGYYGNESYQNMIEKIEHDVSDLDRKISKNHTLIESYLNRTEKLESTVKKLSDGLLRLDFESLQEDIKTKELYIKEQRKIIQEKSKLLIDLMDKKSKTDKIISDLEIKLGQIGIEISEKKAIKDEYEKQLEVKMDTFDRLYSFINTSRKNLEIGDIVGDLDGFDDSRLLKIKSTYTDLNAIKGIKLEIEEYTRKKLNIGAIIKDLDSKIGGRSLDSTALKEAELLNGELLLRLDEIKKEEAQLKYKIDDAKNRLELVEELEGELKSLEVKFSDVRELEKNLKGNKFVEYLAQIYLKNIVIDASKRLDWITSGRYSIEINSDYMFVVRDNFNGGVRRSADTLSGGETFLVSLALALALSSQIQLKGSAPLEFFFLDEGFGSLDTGLLDTVMTSLERLHSDHLSVGIISHVEELKARVPMKLLVSLDDKDASSVCRIEPS